MSNQEVRDDKYDPFTNYNGEVRLWMRKDTAHVGYAYPATWLGPLWFFKKHDQFETLTGEFCNFIDDPNDPKSLPRSAFVDLGPL